MRIAKANKGKSWEIGDDVIYLFNYEKYFVDGICQRKPQYLYLEKIIVSLLHSLYTYFNFFFIVRIYF